MPPFFWIWGKLWVVANRDCELPEDAWLLLHPATEEQKDNYLELVLELVSNADEEAFWMSAQVDEDRLSGRRVRRIEVVDHSGTGVGPTAGAR